VFGFGEFGFGEFAGRMKTIPAQSPTRIAPETRRLVQAAAQACEDKKGQDTRILELDPVDSGLADFFLVTSALNDRQAIAIADEIELKLKRDFGVGAHSVEGRRNGEWILLDYVDFVVHVFLTERRAFYDIERLRKSARPFTAEEFDEELKAALGARTRAARRQAQKAPREKPARKTANAAARRKTTAKRVTAKKAKPKR
jgi:ribosome-associated protein